MNNKKNQTVKSFQRVAFGKTTKMPLSSRIMGRSTSASSKKQSQKSLQKPILTDNIFTKTIRKSQLQTKSIKNQFDEMINDLFLKIDFDCSGFITHTKIGYCKEIPEKVFYFFGGVFQKVKKLGGVAIKMFIQLC